VSLPAEIELGAF